MNLPMEMTIGDIANLIGGRVVGPKDTKVSRFCPSPLAAKEGDIAVLFEAKMLKQLPEVKASAVILPEGTKTDLPAIFVERPLVVMQKMLGVLGPKRFFPQVGVHPTAVIDPSVKLGKDVAIGPFVVIGPNCEIGDKTKIMASTVIGGKVKIGNDCLLHPGCLIADYTQIGNRVILQQGASIGPDGYSYVTQKMSNMERRLAGIRELVDESNPHLKIPNIGHVVIEDDVEIGSCATIDRATIGTTTIGAGTKIDNLVMIAHNNRIGREVLIIGQTGIGGSCVIGDRAILAGQAGLKDHLTVGKDAIVEAKTGVMRDIAAEEIVTGTPAEPMREFFTGLAYKRKLPKMNSDIKALNKKVEELEAKIAALTAEKQLAK